MSKLEIADTILDRALELRTAHRTSAADPTAR